MTETSPIVFVVDDDPSVRRSLSRLIRSAGLRVEAFALAAEYLDHAPPERPACLVLDVRMPGMTGFELQRRMAGTEYDLPVVLITGDTEDVEVRKRALSQGVVAFLYKPFDEQVLLAAIHRAIDMDRRVTFGA